MWIGWLLGLLYVVEKSRSLIFYRYTLRGDHNCLGCLVCCRLSQRFLRYNRDCIHFIPLKYLPHIHLVAKVQKCFLRTAKTTIVSQRSQCFLSTGCTLHILFTQGVKRWLTFSNSNKHFHSAGVTRLLPSTVLVHILIHDSSFKADSLYPDVARQPGNVCFLPTAVCINYGLHAK